MSKKYDVAVKTGTYTDKDGNEKNSYVNVGVVKENHNQDGTTSMYMIMKRTFNPAGVPNPENLSLIHI